MHEPIVLSRPAHHFHLRACHESAAAHACRNNLYLCCRDDVKKRTYAKIAAQRTAERQAQQDREVLLAAKWPHGMSVSAFLGYHRTWVCCKLCCSMRFLIHNALTVRLLTFFKHGMQATARREAAQQGIVAAGLGYGFPLSLPNRQYEALKPGMKWY